MKAQRVYPRSSLLILPCVRKEKCNCHILVWNFASLHSYPTREFQNVNYFPSQLTRSLWLIRPCQNNSTPKQAQNSVMMLHLVILHLYFSVLSNDLNEWIKVLHWCMNLVVRRCFLHIWQPYFSRVTQSSIISMLRVMQLHWCNYNNPKSLTRYWVLKVNLFSLKTDSPRQSELGVTLIASQCICWEHDSTP